MFVVLVEWHYNSRVQKFGGKSMILESKGFMKSLELKSLWKIESLNRPNDLSLKKKRFYY